MLQFTACTILDPIISYQCCKMTNENHIHISTQYEGNHECNVDPEKWAILHDIFENIHKLDI